MEYVTLNNGVKMPQLGFGVFQIKDPAVNQVEANVFFQQNESQKYMQSKGGGYGRLGVFCRRQE